MQRFEILPGLPPYGPMAEQFSATGRGTHSQGLVVKFFTSTETNWVGNFQPGMTNCSAVLDHPNGNDLIVISGGQAYVIDPETRKLRSTFGCDIEFAVKVSELHAIVFGNGLWFEAVDSKGLMWRSKRISWDGMQALTIEGMKLSGQAWSPLDDKWFPFKVDLNTGSFEGGSYNLGDT